MNLLQFFVLCSFLVLGTSRAVHRQEEEASISVISDRYAKNILGGIKLLLSRMYNSKVQFAVLCLIPQDGSEYSYDQLKKDRFCKYETFKNKSTHTEGTLLERDLPRLMTSSCTR